jgi:N-acetylglucosamine kinase-like BadF-type ATPase
MMKLKNVMLGLALIPVGYMHTAVAPSDADVAKARRRAALEAEITPENINQLLHDFALQGADEAVNVLLRRGANPNARVAEDGRTALEVARERLGRLATLASRSADPRLRRAIRKYGHIVEMLSMPERYR